MRVGWIVALMTVGCASAERRDELLSGGSTTWAPDDAYDDEDDGESSCENGPLYFMPVLLPRAFVGKPYAAHLPSFAEPGWGLGSAGYDAPRDLHEDFTFDATFENLSGTPTEPTRLEFTISAYFDLDENGCSIHPDEQEFALNVVASPDGTETDTDSSDTDGTTGGSGTGANTGSGSGTRD